jgi:hypothetical protein
MTISEVTTVVRKAFDAKEIWPSVIENKEFNRVVVPVSEEKTFLIDIQKKGVK